MTVQLADINRSGTLAARPAASAVLAGVTYFATDTGVGYVCDGGAWVNVGSNGAITAKATLFGQSFGNGATVGNLLVGGDTVSSDWLRGLSLNDANDGFVVATAGIYEIGLLCNFSRNADAAGDFVIAITPNTPWTENQPLLCYIPNATLAPSGYGPPSYAATWQEQFGAGDTIQLNYVGGNVGDTGSSRTITLIAALLVRWLRPPVLP